MLRDWVLRFNTRGPDGLIDGKATGQPSKFNDEQRQALARIVEKGPIPAIHGVGAGLVLPRCNTQAMQWHLDEISSQVTPGAHAVLIVDRAGWHTTNKLVIRSNITIMLLPPRAPELNPVENIWQFMRGNWLSNRIFKSYDEIVAICCEAWNKLIDQPWKIMSIGRRQWAYGSCPSDAANGRMGSD